MTTFISAAEAADRLGVQPATLYAYVSRGRIERVRSIDGRRSLFAADAIDELAKHSRQQAAARPSFLPVHIDTSITELGESMLRFRGHDALELVRSASFEQVAELLWTGVFRDDVGPWVPPESIHRDAARSALTVGGSVFSRLSAAMLAAGRTVEGGDALASARILIAAAPSALGAPATGPMARRIAQLWFTSPDRKLIEAVRRVLVLLADHELATSTFAARVAASTRTELAGCLVVSLSALSGPLHGDAARGVHQLLQAGESRSVEELIAGYRARREAVPGFGHKVYKSGDPRVGPILDAARLLGAGTDRVARVDEFLQVAANRLPVAPNVDLALGALSYIADLPSNAPAVMFCIARMAGTVAHVLEEYEAAPVRFRTTARYVGRPVLGEQLLDE